MARIRSVHPSLFTDEAWVSCTPLARLLYVGLWTDADDQGLFEWKPLQIKMRLLPGDGCDVADLLQELANVGLIAKVTEAPKPLGAIKDFRKYQRPKKPNAVHKMPSGWGKYVGLSDEGSEPANDKEPAVPHQFPTSGENSPQMEDGGEDGGSEDKSSDAESRVVHLDHDAEAWRQAVRLLTSQGRMTEAKARPFFGRLVSANKLQPRDLLPSLAAATVSGTQDPQGYLTAAAAAVANRRTEQAKPKRVAWV